MQPEKIIVRGVNWLGDAVMTTPALRRLREARPQAHISLVTPAKLADLWQGHPDIDTVFPLERGESVFDVGRRVRDEKFDLGLVFPNSPRSALELYLGRVPKRVGYGKAWRSQLLTDLVPEATDGPVLQKKTVREIKSLIESTPSTSAPIPAVAHHIHHYLRLVSALGGDATPLAPKLYVSEADTLAVEKKWLLERIENQPWFGLNPGAEYGPAKRWPADRFVAAAVSIQRRTGCRWLIFGGKADIEFARQMAADIRNALVSTDQARLPETAPVVLNLAGQTTLRELSALLKLCRVLITNDSGPMHLAAAVGTPVVAPFGSTSPELTGPGLPGTGRNILLKSDVSCAPCFLRQCPIDFRCMLGHSVESVVTAAFNLVK